MAEAVERPQRDERLEDRPEGLEVGDRQRALAEDRALAPAPTGSVRVGLARRRHRARGRGRRQHVAARRDERDRAHRVLEPGLVALGRVRVALGVVEDLLGRALQVEVERERDVLAVHRRQRPLAARARTAPVAEPRALPVAVAAAQLRIAVALEPRAAVDLLGLVHLAHELLHELVLRACPRAHAPQPAQLVRELALVVQAHGVGAAHGADQRRGDELSLGLQRHGLAAARLAHAEPGEALRVSGEHVHELVARIEGDADAAAREVLQHEARALGDAVQAALGQAQAPLGGRLALLDRELRELAQRARQAGLQVLLEHVEQVPQRGLERLATQVRLAEQLAPLVAHALRLRQDLRRQRVRVDVRAPRLDASEQLPARAVAVLARRDRERAELGVLERQQPLREVRLGVVDVEQVVEVGDDVPALLAHPRPAGARLRRGRDLGMHERRGETLEHEPRRAAAARVEQARGERRNRPRIAPVQPALARGAQPAPGALLVPGEQHGDRRHVDVARQRLGREAARRESGGLAEQAVGRRVLRAAPAVLEVGEQLVGGFLERHVTLARPRLREQLGEVLEVLERGLHVQGRRLVHDRRVEAVPVRVELRERPRPVPVGERLAQPLPVAAVVAQEPADVEAQVGGARRAALARGELAGRQDQAAAHELLALGPAAQGARRQVQQLAHPRHGLLAGLPQVDAAHLEHAARVRHLPEGMVAPEVAVREVDAVDVLVADPHPAARVEDAPAAVRHHVARADQVGGLVGPDLVLQHLHLEESHEQGDRARDHEDHQG